MLGLEHEAGNEEAAAVSGRWDQASSLCSLDPEIRTRALVVSFSLGFQGQT